MYDGRVDAGSGGRLRRYAAAVLLMMVATGGLTACDSSEPDRAEPEDTDATADVRGGDPVEASAGIPEIVRAIAPSVVAVVAGNGEGSGVVFRADGVVVTNNHVVEGSTRVEIAFADGKRAPAQVVATDPLTDLAVVRTDRRDLPAASFAQDLPAVGELALAIGNPLGFENTVTAGIVSGLHRSIPGSAQTTQALVDLLQTDAAISPGNSGGALVGRDGKVIGINVAYIPPQASAVSIGFAIPAPTVVEVVEELLRDGRVEHPFLGIQPGPLTAEIASRLGVGRQRGVVVLSVVAGGPAAEAGLRAGDLLIAVDGKATDTPEAFLTVLRSKDPGDRIELRYVRDGSERTATAVLTQRPTR